MRVTTNLSVSYRGVWYDAEVVEETDQRVRVSYRTPARFHVGSTTWTIPHLVWLRKDDERLWWS